MSTRAVAILIQDDQVALIERHRDGRHYFTFPGGGVEAGETPEGTIQREIHEELGLEVAVRRLVAEIWFRGRPQLHYLVEAVGGTFGTGTGPEMVSPHPGRGTYKAVWMPIDQVLDRPVLPRPMAELLFRSQTQGWPEPHPVIQEDDAHPAHPSSLRCT
ncbi:MAG: NUDIX domain-containing protein [Anaerolineales bacterium]|nr:NUDIX domain-containing protein [Anaerolineales bacterium]